MKLAHSINVITAMSVCSICLAQEPDDDVLQSFFRASRIGTSGTNNFFSGPNQNFNVEIAEDKKTASYKFPLPINSSNNELKSSLEIESPFDSSSSRGESFDLDGLKDATTITLGVDYSKIFISESDQDSQAADRLCREFLFAVQGDSESVTCDFRDIKEDAEERFEQATNRAEELVLCQLEEIAAPDSSIVCNKENFSTARADRYAKRKSRYFGMATSALLIPFKLTYGNEEISYIDSALVKELKKSTEPASASIGVSYITHSYMFGIGFEWQKEFEPGDEGAVCNPSSFDQPLTCLVGLIDAPERGIGRNIFLEARTNRLSTNFGLGIKVVHDYEDDETGVEVPIYFIGQNPWDLNAGVKLGWLSTANESGFGGSFFIGSTFSFFD